MIALGFIGFIGFIIVTIIIGLCVAEIKAEGNDAIATVFLILGVIGLLFILIHMNSIPTALDVYKGKTGLRITYEGKIPVDSVVIYKK